MKGEDVILDLMPTMTVRDLKRQLRALQSCEDELTRKMSLVEVIVGDRKLVKNDETVHEAGISPEVAVNIVFSINPVECLSRGDLDVEQLLVVKIPEGATSVEDFAFEDCSSLVSRRLKFKASLKLKKLFKIL